MLVKVFKNIIAYLTVVIAIGYFVYLEFTNSCSTYDYMILSLLILIATSFMLEMLDDENKWKNYEKRMKNEISSVSDCRIITFDNTSDWVEKIRELMKDGSHTLDSAALDKTTRSKAKKQYSSIFDLLNDCSRDSNIRFRHILRVRHNNFNNLLSRISAGSASKNSYFAYYELPQQFSFPTFGIIDNRYVITRSPYVEGETPQYLIIDNDTICSFFVKYFDDLWRESTRITSAKMLEVLAQRLEFSEDEMKEISRRISEIDRQGIIDDI